MQQDFHIMIFVQNAKLNMLNIPICCFPWLHLFQINLLSHDFDCF